jgi:putative chitinase
MIDAKKLQRALGLVDDGAIGRDTCRALFARFGAAQSIASELGMAANVHLRTYGVLDTPLRLAHFMAQVAHESGGFRYMEEMGGASYFAKYDDAKRFPELGNTTPGDGARYHGRGPIQLTGRANYRTFGQRAGIDIEAHPEVVALPSFGLLVACMFWDSKGLNALADADDVEAVTRKINGGVNGLDERKAYLVKAKGLLL